MAAHLSTKMIINHGDKISVGSGRGVYFTIRGMAERQRLNIEDVQIASLSGAVLPAAHGTPLNMFLDADLHASLLGPCFSRPVSTETLSLPIAHEHLDVVRKHTHLAPKRYEESPPDHALIGIGVLGPGHKLFDIVEGATQVGKNHLFHVMDDLTKVVKLTKKLSSCEHHYVPVADVANRLYPIEPPFDLKHQFRPELNELKGLIKKINTHLLTVRIRQLARIRNIMVVAGTPNKARAIHRFLNCEVTKVRTLCTNLATAQLILEIEKTRDSMNRRRV